MKVNINNVRKQAIYAYELLCEKLNASILKENQYAKPNDVYHGQEINIKGYCLICAEDIQAQMDELRSLIGTMAYTYIEGDEDFKDVYEEIYPLAKGQSMVCFNEEIEQE